MTMTLPRRRFFVTAGLGAAGALALPLTPLGAAQQAPSRDDAVLHHVGREMARLYTVTRSQPMYAEHYLTLAANLRLLAMVFPDIRAAARRPLVHDHAAHGRRVEEVRRHFGLDISGEPEIAPLSGPDEARVRAKLAKEGLAPTLNQMADLAEARAAQVARSGGVPQLRHVQSGLWCTLQPAVEFAVQVVCANFVLGAGGVQGQVACAVAQMTIIVWRWVC